MLKRGIPSMAGNGQQGHVGGHDNMFNNNRGGFGGNPGGGGGGPYFGDGKGQTWGGGGSSGDLLAILRSRDLEDST
jgi:hypothetical protein